MFFPEPLFRDRREAGLKLGGALLGERGTGTVVVGLARGGVEVAAEVARGLEAPLDVVAVRKVGHPLQHEYAIGAVTPGDGVYVRARDGLTDEEVADAVAEAQAKAVALDRTLHASQAPLDLAGRTALVVDDGLATGATMIAAVHWARGRGAARVVAAVPVAAAPSAKTLRTEADGVVCLFELSSFGSVGFWYERFDQVEDDEVIRLLAVAAGRLEAAAR